MPISLSEARKLQSIKVQVQAPRDPAGLQKGRKGAVRLGGSVHASKKQGRGGGGSKQRKIKMQENLEIMDVMFGALVEVLESPEADTRRMGGLRIGRRSDKVALSSLHAPKTIVPPKLVSGLHSVIKSMGANKEISKDIDTTLKDPNVVSRVKVQNPKYK